MGRGRGDAEGAWAGLGDNDAGDRAKLTADLGDQGLARSAIRLAPLLTLVEHRFDARRCRSDKLC